MTTYAKSPASNWSHSSDAYFREWGKAISDGLAAVGLVQTADTGQIDWATVIRAGISSDAGYEIWRFDDDSQSAAPIYLKVRYGTGSSTSIPRCQIDIGAGSDGSGSLTGTTQSSAAQIVCSANATTSNPIRMVGADGLVALDWGYGTSGRVARFAIERLRDADGTASTRGIVAISAADSAASVYTKTASGWANTDSCYPIGWPSTDTTRSFISGTTVYLAPCIPWSGDSDATHGTPYERTLAFMAGAQGLGGGTTVSVDRWDGNSHTYKCTGTAYADVRLATTVTYCFMLWE